MRGSSVGLVKASKSSKFKVGELALTNFGGWTELAVVHDKYCDRIADTGESLRRSAIDALSVVVSVSSWGRLR